MNSVSRSSSFLLALACMACLLSCGAWAQAQEEAAGTDPPLALAGAPVTAMLASPSASGLDDLLPPAAAPAIAAPVPSVPPAPLPVAPPEPAHQPPASPTSLHDGIDARRLSLDALAELAARTHAATAASRSNVRSAEAEQEAAWQQYLPSPSVSFGTGSGRTDSAVGLSQPIWSGGRIEAGVQTAKARTQSAKLAVMETQQNLAFNVAAAYQAFVQARGREEVLEAFLQRLDGYGASMQRRVDAGASALSDLDLLRSRVATAQTQLQAARSAEEIALTQLSQLTGRPLTGADIAIVKTPQALEPMEAVMARAEDYSPTLRRLASEIEVAAGQQAARKAALLPSVALVLQRDMPRGDPTRRDQTVVQLQLQYVPGAGLSSYSAVESAQALVESARQNRESARTDLVSKVRSEYEDAQSVLRSEPQVRGGAQSTANVLASFERLFLAGKRSWVDVMNTARELSDAEVAVADLEARKVGGRYRIALYAGEPEWMDHAD